MSTVPLPRRHLVKLVGFLLVVFALLANHVETRGWVSEAAPRSRFRFTALPLAEPDGVARSVREVRPNLRGVDAWLSAYGAAVAVGDLDGDGLANELCHVDPRWDKVLVSPAPGTGARFPLFVLEPSPDLFDASTMAPTGCVLGDLNADGRLDAAVSYLGRTPLVFLQQEGEGRLEPSRFVVDDIVPTGERWCTTVLTLADLDGDGRLDIVVGNYYPDGVDILNAADSGPDPAMAMHDSWSTAFNGGRNRILRQTGSAPSPAPAVTFEDVPVLGEDVARGWTLAIGAPDLDGDLLPELYFANDFGPDRLLHNRSAPGSIRFDLVEGDLDFITPPSKVLGHDSFKGMGVDFTDLNEDGRLDIFVSNIAHDFGFQESNFLFVSREDHGDLNAYRDESRPLGVAQSGFSWDARFGDFDNDTHAELMVVTGLLGGHVSRWADLAELVIANDRVVHDVRWWPALRGDAGIAGEDPNRFFVRGNGTRYVDMAAQAGLSSRAVARALATADIDGDGDLDMIVANQWAPSTLYRNECVQCGQSLVLNLRHRPVGAVGGEPGRVAAIGAAAVVTLPDGRRLIGQVDGGWGHSGKRSPELLFGLGDVPPDVPLEVTLTWRDLQGRPHTHTIQLAPGRHDLTLDDLVATPLGADR